MRHRVKAGGPWAWVHSTAYMPCVHAIALSQSCPAGPSHSYPPLAPLPSPSWSEAGPRVSAARGRDGARLAATADQLGGRSPPRPGDIKDSPILQPVDVTHPAGVTRRAARLANIDLCPLLPCPARARAGPRRALCGTAPMAGEQRGDAAVLPSPGK